MAKGNEYIPPEGPSPLGRLPVTLQEAMGNWFGENSSLGQGDLRTPVTFEALQRTEQADYWVVNRKRLGRAEIMEMMLDLVASGFSMPTILATHGMPKPRTVMTWLADYRPFADLMETSEKMRAIILSEQALEILDGSQDDKQAFRDNARATLRMKMAEVMHSKKFGRKQQVDITHHLDDLMPEEVWTRFSSILQSHKDMIEAKTGIKIEVPFQEAEVVKIEAHEEPEADQMTLGMEGTPSPAQDFNDNLEL